VCGECALPILRALNSPSDAMQIVTIKTIINGFGYDEIEEMAKT